MPLRRLAQPPQQRLEIQPLPDGEALRAKGAEAGEIRRQLGGFRQGISPDQRPGEDAGKQVPCAVELSGGQGSGDKIRPARGPVKAHRSRPVPLSGGQ